METFNVGGVRRIEGNTLGKRPTSTPRIGRLTGRKRMAGGAMPHAPRSPMRNIASPAERGARNMRVSPMAAVGLSMKPRV